MFREMRRKKQALPTEESNGLSFFNIFICKEAMFYV